MRILVVDDSVAVRSRLVSRLAEAGCEVVGEACDGETALVLATSLVPDAVVLDLQLPGLSGLEVLRALKSAARAPRVLVLTNAAHARHRCLELGADLFVDKSSAFDALDAVIGALT